jgi:hypothetical protein
MTAKHPLIAQTIPINTPVNDLQHQLQVPSFQYTQEHSLTWWLVSLNGGIIF